MVGAVRSSYKMAHNVKAFLELRPKWLRCELYCFVFFFQYGHPCSGTTRKESLPCKFQHLSVEKRRNKYI